ncbi:poly-beta-hydroxybutyrate polymerase N-terminal domain-containing protein [Legionella fallonii]|uniref:Poly-beta-hydroxybutyrate polymerase N-terminal domain-containing protein n=1 Tax=Legionella fallonii LLAP-10 TaxID=1212491 RepID=A0A098G7A3_9GAMM|nr:poly-beta-hydroxybutyrate polymerase N-terminal domain-containing protein [Legionella fallonii]CEG58343.1 conserved protein of unknown function [Legionella fallonii LLAP-10]
MNKQGIVRRHNKNSLSLVESNLSGSESKDSLKVRIDKPLHAWLSHSSGWLSLPSVLSAYSDWLTHFDNSPDKKLDLINNTTQKNIQFLVYLMHSCSGQKCEPCIDVKQSDHRFQNTLWEQFSFNIYIQSFLAIEIIGDEETTDARGVWKHGEVTADVVEMMH